MAAGGGCPGSVPVGWIVGESTPQVSLVLFDSNGRRTASVGLYVIAEGPEGCVLGMVESVSSGNTLLPDEVTDHEEVEALTRYPPLLDKGYKRGWVRWLSLLDPLLRSKTQRLPTTPLDPGTRVYVAPPSVLRGIFQGDEGEGWVPIGTILRTRDSEKPVPFSIEVNKLFRHLAILAVTGGGKSNTVCVLATRIVGDLGGTMVLFDVHGEYAGSIDLRTALGGRVNVVEPKINPAKLELSEILKLAKLPENASVQERIIRDAWKKTIEEYEKGQVLQGDLLKRFLGEVKAKTSSPDSSERRAAVSALNRLEDMLEVYKDVIDPNYYRDLEKIIKPGTLTIFDLSGLDEAGADAVVSHYLRRILGERKLYKRTEGSVGYPVPILVAIEEAHVLIPRDRPTLTKYWASRVAREGRKFGVGLIIVSQRPKKLDDDVLSQTNNKIILRIVEPTDQRYVREASEQLSEDLTRVLPSLNPGEAIVVGSMTRLPALVKIDECPARTGGTDVNAVEEWARHAELEEGEAELASDTMF
ncbi:helicase HerA-like domain-containing protein [Stetteria hydrogenophila]